MPVVKDKKEQLSVIYTLVPRKNAREIGTSLVEEKLAACINIVSNVSSIFKWQGSISNQKEAILLIKTTASVAKSTIARIKELHPYEVPCIVCFSVKVPASSMAYLKWVKEQTA